MPSNPDSSFAFRDIGLAKFYRENYQSDRKARSLIAKRDLERYHWLLQQELLKVLLTEAEAIALWSALNGCSTTDTETLDILRNGIISEVAEAAEDTPELQNLQGILMALSPGQWFAVIDACDRVGAGAYHVENLADELKRVGLIE